MVNPSVRGADVGIKSGVQIDTAMTTAEAKTLLEHGSFQLIIADVVLHGSEMNGDEFIVQNSHLMRGADIVLVSGYPRNVIKKVVELEKLGVTFLKKSVGRLQELRRIVGDTKTRTEGFLHNVSQPASSVVNDNKRLAEQEFPGNVSPHAPSLESHSAQGCRELGNRFV